MFFRAHVQWKTVLVSDAGAWRKARITCVSSGLHGGGLLPEDSAFLLRLRGYAAMGSAVRRSSSWSCCSLALAKGPRRYHCLASLFLWKNDAFLPDNSDLRPYVHICMHFANGRWYIHCDLDHVTWSGDLEMKFTTCKLKSGARFIQTRESWNKVLAQTWDFKLRINREDSGTAQGTNS